VLGLAHIKCVVACLSQEGGLYVQILHFRAGPHSADAFRSGSKRPCVQGPSFYSGEGRRRIVFQIWDWIDHRRYTFHLYVTRELGNEWQTFHTAAVYRVLRREELTVALREARFKTVHWLLPPESGFYQPIVLAETD
jgi:hypothetical protein